MAHVVFLRAGNVGGKNVFRPAQVARALAHLDVVNVGAAGTFLVRAKASPSAIRREILAQLSFVPDLAVVPTQEIEGFVAKKPFTGVRIAKNQRAWVAVLCGKPKALTDLPLIVPAGKLWSVRFERVEGVFAHGLWQRQLKGFVFPSQVVEKALGVRVTTRWWETIERVAKLIESTRTSPRREARAPRRRRSPARAIPAAPKRPR